MMAFQIHPLIHDIETAHDLLELAIQLQHLEQAKGAIGLMPLRHELVVQAMNEADVRMNEIRERMKSL